ncbi:MAG TPA: hypothetical protein VIK28_05150 [Sedimentisphaerales bacterium]
MEGNSPNQNSQKSAEKMRLAVEKLEREVFKPDPLPERTLPWLIDIFLYPMNISGVIHMVIFAIIPPLLWLLVLRYIHPFGGVPYLILYLLLAGYAFYYISYCVFDSSRGGLRAPDVTIYDSPDKIELFSQVFLVIGVVAVCFFPAVIYYITTERIDLLFWLLSAVCIFFLPMAVLTAVLFDSVDALNPVTIITSIYRTFLPYCGLVLAFSVLAGLIAPVILGLPKPGNLIAGLIYLQLLMDYLLGTAYFWYKIAFVYLSIVSAHLLGRFYLRYKKELNWGI